MTPADILNAAADLIDVGWCQGTDARAESGLATSPHRDSAVEWCATGAVNRAAYADHGGPDRTPDREWLDRGYAYDHALEALQNELPEQYGREEMPEATGIQAWNDSEGMTADVVAETMRRAAR